MKSVILALLLILITPLCKAEDKLSLHPIITLGGGFNPAGDHVGYLVTKDYLMHITDNGKDGVTLLGVGAKYQDDATAMVISPIGLYHENFNISLDWGIKTTGISLAYQILF